MKKEILKVVFRYDKKYHQTNMFFLGDRNSIECFTMEEGHNLACYDYYLSTKLIKDPTNNKDVKNIIKYYESSPHNITIRVMQKLNRSK